jgi:hypothetical protein
MWCKAADGIGRQDAVRIQTQGQASVPAPIATLRVSGRTNWAGTDARPYEARRAGSVARVPRDSRSMSMSASIGQFPIDPAWIDAANEPSRAAA